MIGTYTPRTGIRRLGPTTNMAAAGIANTVTIYQISNSALLINAVKSLIAHRLRFRNQSGANTWLHVGTGLGALLFADIITPILIVNTFDGWLPEFDMMQFEVSADITAYVEGAPGDVQIEVEELG